MKYVFSKNFFALILILFLTISFSSPLFAQLTDFNSSISSIDPDVKEQIDIKVSPANPKPFDSVTVSLEAYGTDLNKASISWKLNGKIQKSGIGVKSFSFNAGALGTASTVLIDVVPINGTLIEKSVEVSAQSIDILWEANSYVPPFYKGRSFYTPEGQITFMAMPNLTTAKGTKIDPKSLIYTWRIDNTAHADMSGFGRNSYVFTGDILGQETLAEVHVATVDGSIQGDGSIIINPSNAEVYAYENNPTYGILFNTALQNGFALKNTEINLSAFPYFFNIYSRNDPVLSYTWSVNSALINAPNTQKDIVFRNTNNDEGESIVSVGITNSDKILQNANNNFSMELNKKSEEPFNF